MMNNVKSTTNGVLLHQYHRQCQLESDAAQRQRYDDAHSSMCMLFVASAIAATMLLLFFSLELGWWSL